MVRRTFSPVAILVLLQFILGIGLSPPSLAQEWALRRPRGTLRVVDLVDVSTSVKVSYSEPLMTLDKDNNWVPCLAEDWRWMDDRTLEFRLRRGVFFHNGEKFNAEAVRVNWEYYKEMANPTWFRFIGVPQEAVLEVVDEYTVRFTFPEPNGLAFVQLQWFRQIAPAFFTEHKFEEPFYGHLSEPGPWGTGPFKLVEGGGWSLVGPASGWCLKHTRTTGTAGTQRSRG